MSSLVREAERQWLAAVGLRVKLSRVVRRESQRELADRAGLTSTTVGQIERGEHSAGVLTYRRIADALGMDVGELLSERP